MVSCVVLPSRVVRHHSLNKCVSRAFSVAGIPVKMEPTGLAHKDGKRLDSCTLIPWRGVNNWLVMLQSAPQWPIHTWPLQAMKQEPSPNKLLTGTQKGLKNAT